MATQPAVKSDNPLQFYAHAQVDNMVRQGIRKKLGFSRDPKPVLPEMPPIYIYNVSDREHKWHQPGFTFFTIPACGEDEKYSAPIYWHEDGKKHEGIPGLVQYEYLKIDSTSWAIHQGEEIAAEIMNVGPGKQPENDLRKVGLFASRHNPPKPEEVAEAQRIFLAHLEELVKEGNFIHSQGQSKGPNGQMIGSEHLWAAKLLGQQTEWSRGVRQMVACPHCQCDMPANAAVHFGPGGCGGVIDPDRALEAGLIDQKKYDQIKAARAKRES